MKEQKKKKYTRPQIRKVRLDAEVLLGTACKTTAGTDKTGRTCHKLGACANNVAGS